MYACESQESIFKKDNSRKKVKITKVVLYINISFFDYESIKLVLVVAMLKLINK